MKAKIHSITALFLLTLSAMAGPFLNVRTEKQRAIIDAQVQTNMELRVFVGDESLGWSLPGSRTGGAVSATIETSSEIRLDDGSLGKGFIFRAADRTNYVAITPGGSVPFGEFIIRDHSQVIGIGATAIFADIRKPDGTLVPVSVGVRKPQSDAKPEFSPVIERVLTDAKDYLDSKSVLLRAKDWETLPAAELVKRLAAAPDGSTPIADMGADLTALLTALKAGEKKEVRQLRWSNWGFKTRQGNVGILQVTGFGGDQPGVDIRYKLVQEKSKTGPATNLTHNGSPVPSDIAANTNGPDALAESQQRGVTINTPMVEAQLKGDWELVEADQEGFRQRLSLAGGQFSGHWQMDLRALPTTIAWFVDGAKLRIFHYYEPNLVKNYRVKELIFDYRVDGDTLTLTNGGKTLRWRRVKSLDPAAGAAPQPK